MFVLTNVSWLNPPADPEIMKRFEGISTFKVEISAENDVLFFDDTDELDDDEYWIIPQADEITVDGPCQTIRIRYNESETIAVQLAEPDLRLTYFYKAKELIAEADEHGQFLVRVDKIVKELKSRKIRNPYASKLQVYADTPDYSFSIMHVTAFPNAKHCKHWYCLASYKNFHTGDYALETCWGWKEVRQFVMKHLPRKEYHPRRNNAERS